MNVLRTVVAGIVLISGLVSSERALAQAVARFKVNLEVTQGIQYFEHPTEGTNTIDLVAGRPTVVRATIPRIPPGKKVASVRGSLTVASAPGTPPAPKLVVSEFLNADELKAFLNAGAAWDRANPNATLNVKVNSLAPGHWDFKEELKLTFTDGSAAIGQGKASLEAVAIKPIRIRLVPLRFKTRGGLTRDPPDKTMLKREAEWLLKACFPLSNEVKIDWLKSITVPTTDKGAAGQIDDEKPDGGKSDVDEVLHQLEAKIQTGEELQFVFGWVDPRSDSDTCISDDAAVMIYGWSSCAGAGFGTALPAVAGKVFAHEFGHMLGLDHCSSCEDSARSCSMEDQVGWDVYDGPGTSVQTDRVSFMVCGKPEKKVWITPKDYVYCLKALELKDDSTSIGCRSADPQHDKPGVRALVVRGRLTPDGERIAWLDHVFRYSWKTLPTREMPGGPYEVEAADASGTPEGKVKLKFNARMRIEPGAGKPRFAYGFFSLVVPFPEDREVQTIAIRKGDTILRTVTVLEPLDMDVIQIRAPQPESALSQATRIEWALKAEYARAANLRYQVFYSPDGGEHFEPVDVNLKTLTTIFDPREFPESQEGTGVIRVFVSDALKTVYQDIAKISVGSN